MDTLYLEEKSKYEKMWEHDLYRQRSPGALLSPFFFYHFQQRIKPGDSIIDFGCGTAAASMTFFDMGLFVTLVDIANNCLSVKSQKLLREKNKRFLFVEAPLWDLPPEVPVSDWIYCIDVLEHLPEDRVKASLEAMAKKTKKGGALQIFLEEESMGELIGETLHLTLRPLNWWLDLISAFWVIENVQEILPDVRYCVYVGHSLCNSNL